MPFDAVRFYGFLVRLAGWIPQETSYKGFITGIDVVSGAFQPVVLDDVGMDFEMGNLPAGLLRRSGSGSRAAAK